MPQQKGFKRAKKVLERKRKIAVKTTAAAVRKVVRQAELEEKEKAGKSKK